MGLAGTAESWAGSGSGYGSGDGSGDGYGYGSGDGSGDGYGYGSGDVVASDLPERPITADQLRDTDACSDGVDDFESAFPDGATYPTDLARARELGLDVGWISHLGLFVPEETTDHD